MTSTTLERGETSPSDLNAGQASASGAAASSRVLLGVVAGSVIGWARAGDKGPAEVQLFVGDRQVGAAFATRPPAKSQDLDLMEQATSDPVALSAGADWFSIKVPVELRTGQPLAIRVGVAGEVFGSTTTRLYGGLKAKFVMVRDGVVHGYLANPFGPEAPPAIEVRLDGRSIGQFEAEAATADGRRRFAIPLPVEVRDGETHQVSVCWAGTTIDLQGSPSPWKAPEPQGRKVVKARGLEEGPARTRADYRLPAAELSVVADMLADQALAARFGSSVAEHSEDLWRRLEAPTGAAGLNLFLTANTFGQVDGAFGLGQLLTLEGGAALRVILPSEEAVRAARETGAADARDQLASPLTSADLVDLVGRLPADDVMVFVPARTLLTPAFLAEVKAVIAGERDFAAMPCAQAVAAPEGLLVADPVVEGWVSARQAVAAVRVKALPRIVRGHGFTFEGVTFTDVELLIAGGPAGGVTLQAPAVQAGVKAGSAVLFGRAASSARLAFAAELADLVVAAGVGNEAANLQVIAALEGDLTVERAESLRDIVGGARAAFILGEGVGELSPVLLRSVRGLAEPGGLYALRMAAGELSTISAVQDVLGKLMQRPADGFYAAAAPPPVRR